MTSLIRWDSSGGANTRRAIVLILTQPVIALYVTLLSAGYAGQKERHGQVVHVQEIPVKMIFARCRPFAKGQ